MCLCVCYFFITSTLSGFLDQGMKVMVANCYKYMSSGYGRVFVHKLIEAVIDWKKKLYTMKPVKSTAWEVEDPIPGEVLLAR